MQELKECPFCGSDAALVNTKECIWVACKKCGASVKICSNNTGGKEEAIKNWNTRTLRATSPTTAALLEDCLRIIKNIPWSCSHAANKERDNIVERLNGFLKQDGEKQPTA